MEEYLGIIKNKPPFSSKVSRYIKTINRLRIVKIKSIKKEASSIKTFTFQDTLCINASPGQFVMVWIPGVDEVPISLSTITSNGLTSITVAQVGEATKALLQRKCDDVIGIRGPYGNGFTLSEGKTMIIGGGTGVAPLMPLIEELSTLSKKITFLIGARNKDALLFLDRLAQTLYRENTEILVTTEDGSYGHTGTITDHAERKLAKEPFDSLYACGPEIMLKKVDVSPLITNPIRLEHLVDRGLNLMGKPGVLKIQVQF